MPGFKICNYGNNMEGAPINTYETKRKHRWYFETLGRNGPNMPANVLLVLKTATRPNFVAEEPEMHHNQEVVYFAGKHKWDPCKLSWYDVEQNPDVTMEMWTWLNGVVGLDQALRGSNLPVALPMDYKKNATLTMIDGIGERTETWQMCGCWPKEVNYQELDYSNTEIMLIDVTMRFDRAYLD
jgi:hypothetical protein